MGPPGSYLSPNVNWLRGQRTPMADPLPYGMTIEKVRPIFSGRVIRVNVETVRLPNGHVTDLEIIHHPGGAAAVAVDRNRRVCLIRQFRHAANGWIWELPAVQRELSEETGFRARNWRPLGPYLSSPGVFTETVHLFLAQELEAGRSAHEAAELIEVHWMDLEEACRWALDGTIRDGKTALGLLRARAVIDSERALPGSAGV
jgi:8-oxo-dGTP pyrophosphatase MutT (NUDIX family)